MSGTARAWIIVTAVVAVLASAALVLVAVLADLDTAGQAASVAGAVAGLLALLVSVIALSRSGAPAAESRAEALDHVARVLAKAGHPGQAAEIARTITEPTSQARALAAAAKAHGATPEGRSLLRRALSLHSYEDLLDELATVSPEALDEAVRRATTP